MQRFCFRIGQRLLLNSVTYKVWRVLENGDCVLERESDLAHVMRSKAELLNALSNNCLSFVLDGAQVHQSEVSSVKGPLDSCVEEDQETALYRMSYIKLAIREFGEQPSCSKLKPYLQLFAQHLGDSKPPGAYTVYKWWRTWKDSGEDITALVPKQNRGRVSSHLREHHGLLLEVINELLYQRVPGTKQDAYEAFLIKAEQANSLKLIPVPIPSRATVYRLIDKITDPYDLVLHQQGRRAAEQAFRATGEGVRTTRILERVEIDHTPMNIMVVDEVTGEVNGRPSLTAVIDHYSKMPLGIYIGFEPPSFVSVIRAIRNAILPKNDIEKQLPDPSFTWPAYGIMALLACDNGAEFHDKQLERICGELNIELLYCPKQHPWFKGSVERYVGHLNQALGNKMEGTTFSNIGKRGDYESVKEAKCTLQELQRLILKWIITIYNHSFHEGIGDTPFNLWREGLNHFEPSLPVSKESLDLIFTREFTRKINHEGVSFKRLKYNSEALGILRRQLPSSKSARVRVDPENLGSVWVFDEFRGEFISVPCRSKVVAEGLSLRQLEYLLEKRTDRRKAADTKELLQRKVDFVKEVRAAGTDKSLRQRTKAARNSQNPLVEPAIELHEEKEVRGQVPLSLPDDLDDFDIQWG